VTEASQQAADGLPPADGEQSSSPQDTGARGKRRVDVRVCFESYELPPLRDAVIVGREAPVGSRALLDAVERLVPGAYELVETSDHPLVEAVLVRKARMRMVAAERLVDHLLAEAEGLLSSDIALDVHMEVRLSSEFGFELD
jgi:hypothetical protein